MTRKALLVHGFASTFEATWGDAGWPDLLADVGIETLTFELPGHGSSALAGHADMEDVVDALLEAGHGADLAVGFSAGSALLLHASVREPAAFDQLVLLGIGDGMWSTSDYRGSLASRLLDERGDEAIQLLRSTAISAGNQLEGVAAYASTSLGPPALADLAHIAARVLIVLGERDSVGPADILVSALSNATVTMIPRIDHFRTPESPAAMGAVLDFMEM